MTAEKDSPQPEDLPLDLRERRRLDTLREIHEVAVGLFEERGVAATTVDDIAAAAGISPRTFFRYFATKEHAAFAAESDFRDLVEETLAKIRGGAPLFTALQDSWARLFAQIDERPRQHDEAMRLRRLAEGEPTLIALLVVEDGRLDAELAEGSALALGRPADDLVVQAAVISANGAARLAYREWGRLREAGEPATLRGVYARLLAELTAFFREQAPEEPGLGPRGGSPGSGTTRGWAT
ncbi:TetR family transcriptional regulator [Leucobacter sp. M11]|uniref:TetR family transcriptional regulator n=1 Tax=Leucobacter sp. M11 TaxID=2993565 RepID=UPI002D7FEAB3|nr:TetR family transcriptional regulator [Leucobacter sp. M11]MEB4613632.1 TetR family transcriptional regulator [Leucobacter sp. M11]